MKTMGRQTDTGRVLVVVGVVVLMVCASITASRADMDEDQQIKNKGKILFANFRQRVRTLLSLKRAEVKAADLSPRYHAEKIELLTEAENMAREAEYEIKQRIVDAISGEESQDDPDAPALANTIAAHFMDALFANTYEEQTAKEDLIVKLINDLIEQV